MGVEPTGQGQCLGGAQAPAQENAQQFAQVHLRTVSVGASIEAAEQLAGREGLLKPLQVGDRKASGGLVEELQRHFQQVEVFQLPTGGDFPAAIDLAQFELFEEGEQLAFRGGGDFPVLELLFAVGEVAIVDGGWERLGFTTGPLFF